MTKHVLVLGALAALSACALGPDYERPKDPVPAAYKELTGASTGWKIAEPGDDRPKGAWWTLFADKDLDALQAQVLADNQTLKGAEAAVRQARAALGQAQAAFWPQISGTGSGQRVSQAVNTRTTTGRTVTGAPVETDSFALTASASWEIDL